MALRREFPVAFNGAGSPSRQPDTTAWTPKAVDAPATGSARRTVFRGVAATAAMVVLAGPGVAEETTIGAPAEAVLLHEGPLDMVAYYVPAQDDALTVSATFVPNGRAATTADPMSVVSVVMGLGEGDDVAFGMPGYPRALYRFARAGETVTVSVEVGAASI